MAKFYITGERFQSAVCGIGMQNFIKIRQSLLLAGWKCVDDYKKANAIICCFCVFTKDEIDENISLIKKYAEAKGKLYITGCITQAEEIMTPLREKFTFQEFAKASDLISALTNSKKNKELENEEKIEIINGQALILISDGCKPRKNGWCSFCKQWYLQRPLTCKPVETIIQEIKDAVKQGVKFIVLHAMNSTQYQDPNTGSNLCDLLHSCLEIEGVLYQINGLVVSEITDELGNLIKYNPRIAIVGMEIQSFIPSVRKKMNIGDPNALALKKWLGAFSSKAIISNMIVGHPGENSKNFEEQLALIRKANYYFPMIDTLKVTPGTPVAKMEQPDKKAVIKRLQKLYDTIRELRKAKARSLLNKTLSVLVIGKSDEDNVLIGLYESVYIYIYNHKEGTQIGDIIEIVCKNVVTYQNDAQMFIMSDQEEKFDEPDAKNKKVDPKHEAAQRLLEESFENFSKDLSPEMLKKASQLKDAAIKLSDEEVSILEVQNMMIDFMMAFLQEKMGTSRQNIPIKKAAPKIPATLHEYVETMIS